MRKRGTGCKKRSRLKRWAVLAVVGLCTAGLAFSWYVNTEIKPTLHALAEYQARAATVAAMNDAISEALSQRQNLCSGLYQKVGDTLALDTATANLARTHLVAAVEQAMQALPESSWIIPFGTLTNNTLLSGLGPGWQVGLRPQGFVEGTIEERAEPLPVNSLRCTVELVLKVTVNMILDGRTSILVVTNRVPLASVVVTGEIPQYYSD
ncbi:MAG: sporulation protein YunB [Gemmiger sp.]